MKEKAFNKLKPMGKASIFPIALLPLSGIFLGLGTLFTNAINIKVYGLQNILGKVYFVGNTLTVTKTTVMYEILIILSKLGNVMISNLPLFFAIGIAFVFSKYEKAIAALMGAVFFLIMHQTINSFLSATIIPGTSIVTNTPDIPYAMSMAGQELILGIQTLQLGIFGGIISGLIASGLHNKYCKIKLHYDFDSFSIAEFFNISKLAVFFVVIYAFFTGIIFYIFWPILQNQIGNLGFIIKKSGYIGTFLYGAIERILLPFGLQNSFRMPLMYTKMGGEMVIAGVPVQGFQNIFMTQLTDPAVKRFSVEYMKFMAGKYPFMMFGLPAAAIAMYSTASSNRKSFIRSLLFSAAFTSFLVGFTEPLEFLLLFTAPVLYLLHVVLSGVSFVLMHVMNVSTGISFSGGFMDYYMFGVLQGQAKTEWSIILFWGVIYFIIYYFLFKLFIIKFNLKTIGRENIEKYEKPRKKKKEKVLNETNENITESIPESTEDIAESENNENMTEEKSFENEEVEEVSPDENLIIETEKKAEAIVAALGGRENILKIENCSNKLKLEVKNTSIINDAALKVTGALGVLKKETGVQVIYGSATEIIKEKMEKFINEN